MGVNVTLMTEKKKIKDRTGVIHQFNDHQKEKVIQEILG